MALDATPKGSDANSYLTEAEADAYLTGARLYSSVWVDAAAADKPLALIWATAILEVAFNWFGTPTTTTQALSWPRSGLTNRDGSRVIDPDVVPDQVKNAAAELAMELLSSDRSQRPGLLDQGFSEVKVGPIQIKVDPGQVKDLVPAWIVSMLSDFGSPSAAAEQGSDLSTFPVERT